MMTINQKNILMWWKILKTKLRFHMIEQEELLQNARQLLITALGTWIRRETILITQGLGKENLIPISKLFKKFNIEMLVTIGLMVLQEELLRIETTVALQSLSIMKESQVKLVEEEMEVQQKDLMFLNIQILIVF